jgi:hypothetical protein
MMMRRILSLSLSAEIGGRDRRLLGSWTLSAESGTARAHAPDSHAAFETSRRVRRTFALGRSLLSHRPVTNVVEDGILVHVRQRDAGRGHGVFGLA